MRCNNCGVTINEGTKICPNCGTPIEGSINQESNKNFGTNNGNVNSQKVVTPGTTTVSDDTKIIKILSYFGILFLIGMFCNQKNDPNVRFHVGQGMILCICEIAVSIIISLISPLLFFAAGLSNLLRIIASTIILVLAIIGIINAVKNENKPLPVIGAFAFYK